MVKATVPEMTKQLRAALTELSMTSGAEDPLPADLFDVESA